MAASPMKTANLVVYRRLTAADFFNINKPKGMERRGGGQSYIDFPTTAVKPTDWETFFQGVKKSTTRSGPVWEFNVNSLGLSKSQFAHIGQRRPASYSIRAQKLGTKDSNRLYAWHPQYSGFPFSKDPTKRVGVPNLVIYLIRTADGEYWAGWFQTATPKPGWFVNNSLQQMFTKQNGFINLYTGIAFDENKADWPFLLSQKAEPSPALPIVTDPLPSGITKSIEKKTSTGTQGTPPAQPVVKKAHYKAKPEEEIIADLFNDDVAIDALPSKKQAIVTIIQRDQKIVSKLKALYEGKCQITGEKYTFKKLNGEFYSEAHHLIALGLGGADSPYNIIIVSPLIHRMLHYADISDLDLNKIVDNKLSITINGAPYTITWHASHAAVVKGAPKNDE